MKAKKCPGGREGATTANRERNKPFVQGEAYNRAARRGGSGLSSPHVWVPAHLARWCPAFSFRKESWCWAQSLQLKRSKLRKSSVGDLRGLECAGGLDPLARPQAEISH